MKRDELEHAIRAVCDVAGDTEVYVFGSQSILGQHPDASEQLRQSAEADAMPKNHPERVDWVDGALGELSQFHVAQVDYRLDPDDVSRARRLRDALLPLL